MDHYFFGLMARTLNGSMVPKTDGIFFSLMVKEFMTIKNIGSFLPFVKLLDCLLKFYNVDLF
jgi:hypothetical protein